MKPALKYRLRLFFRKIYHQEYWSYYVFYIPVLPYGLYLALRAKSMLYFMHTNPKLKYSGAFDMLKKDILEMTPSENVPTTGFIGVDDLNTDAVLKIAHDLEIQYPFILKPNIGERGKNVAKIRNLEDLELYMQTASEDLIIQEYAGYETHPIEAGVFVNKDPNTGKVEVNNLCYRKFPTVMGDGVSTLDQLVEKDVRTVYKYSYYKEKFGEKFNHVIPQGEEFLLEYIGSHNRGTGFIDKNHLINENLRQVFQNIVDKLDDYYYGRFDLKAKSEKELFEGKFKILEINGINAEPISIYDSQCSFFKAYRVLMKHMKIIFKISQANKKLGNKHPKISFVQFCKAVYNHQTQVVQKANI